LTVFKELERELDWLLGLTRMFVVVCDEGFLAEEVLHELNIFKMKHIALVKSYLSSWRGHIRVVVDNSNDTPSVAMNVYLYYLKK